MLLFWTVAMKFFYFLFFFFFVSTSIYFNGEKESNFINTNHIKHEERLGADVNIYRIYDFDGRNVDCEIEREVI